MTTRQNRPAGMRFIFVTLILEVLGFGLVIPVLPQLVEEMAPGGASDAAGIYGVLVAVYALMQFVCAPFIGALSDRYGRRNVILLALFAFGIDYFLFAFAPTLTWLFIGRVIAGVTGASITTANAYVADVSTPETRAQNFGMVGAAFGLGFILGPALGGLLGEVWLRLPFIVAGGVTLVNVLYGFFVLPESLPVEDRRPFTWDRANPIGGLLALKRYPVVVSLAAAFVFIALAQRGLETVWVLYTNYRYGWGEWENGLALTVVGIMAALVQGFLIGKVSARWGERRIIVVGLVFSVFAFIGYGAAPTGWAVVVVIVVGSLGGLAGPAIQGLVAGAVPNSEQGAVQGSIASLNSLTAIIAPLFATQLFANFSGDDAVMELPGISFFTGAAFVLLALLVVLAALKKHPQMGTRGSDLGQA